MAIALDARPLSADAYRNILDAEARLALLEIYEDLADLHDTEHSDRLRTKFAEQYRRCVGVTPNQRGHFRVGLEHLCNSGAMPVEDLVLRLG